MGGPRPTEQHNNYDFLQPRLDSFIDMRHELVLLAQRIDWERLEALASYKFPSTRGRKAGSNCIKVHEVPQDLDYGAA